MFEGMKYVYEVYKEGSFSKAAKNLMIAQPSLSACVKKEEDRLGVQIFNRNTKPFQLTDPGKEYIKCAKNIMDIQDTFQNYINDYKGLTLGTLNVGANNVYASILLPHIIQKFHELYPNITVNLTEGKTANEFVEQLSTGSIDIAIDNFKTNHKSLDYYHLFSEIMLLAIPQNYAINKKYKEYQLSNEMLFQSTETLKHVPPISFLPFAELPFIVLKKGTETRRHIDNVFSRYEITPNIILELDQTSTATLSACTGMGATFVPNTMATHFDSANLLTYYRIDDENLIRTVNLCVKKNHYITTVEHKFLNLTLEMLSN